MPGVRFQVKRIREPCARQDCKVNTNLVLRSLATKSSGIHAGFDKLSQRLLRAGFGKLSQRPLRAGFGKLSQRPLAELVEANGRDEEMQENFVDGLFGV